MNPNNSRTPSRSPSRDSLDLALNEVLGNAPAPWSLDDLHQQFPLANSDRLPELGHFDPPSAEQPERQVLGNGGDTALTAYNGAPAPDYGLQLPFRNRYPPEQPLGQLLNPNPVYHRGPFGPGSDINGAALGGYGGPLADLRLPDANDLLNGTIPTSDLENSPATQVNPQVTAQQLVDRDHRDRAIIRRMRALRPDLDMRGDVESRSLESPRNVPPFHRQTTQETHSPPRSHSLIPEEDHNPPPQHQRRGRRTTFNAPALDQLARIVVDINPYGARHGDKKDAWIRVLKAFQAAGFCPTTSLETMKNKVNAMLAYHDDPESRAGRSIAHEMDGSLGISIGAQLDVIEQNRLEAINRTDEEKEKAREDKEYNTRGGESIRSNAMRTLHRRKNNNFSDDDSVNDDMSDAAIEEEATLPPKKKARASVKGKSRRHRARSPNAAASGSSTRVEDQASSELSELRDVLVEGEGRRADEAREMREALRESTQVYQQTQAHLLAAILRISHEDAEEAEKEAEKETEE